MLTVAQLNEIRARVRKQLRVRSNGSPVKIIISSGTTAIAAGSRKVMAAVLEEITDKGLSIVQVEQREIEVEAAEHPAVIVCAHGEEVLHKQCTPELIRELISRAVSVSAE